MFNNEGLTGSLSRLAICLQLNPSIRHRIWEKLSEDGWGEEIAARKSMYEPGLLKIKGVRMIRPLGEKGTHVSSS